MNLTADIIHVPIWATVLCAALFISLPFCLILFSVKRRKAGKQSKSGKPDWSVPTIDAYAEGTSFFHRWDPRVKIITLFGCCFMVVSLHRLSSCFIALAIAVIGVHFCHIPWLRARRRLMAMSGFLSMFLVIIPFTSPTRSGETLLVFPFLSSFPFHLQGFIVALTISLKACTVALLMEPMFGTAPLTVSLQALDRLGLPSVMGQMILLTHRYIFVFLKEVIRMHRSMKVRGFSAGTNLVTMRTMGNFFGMLFIRSYERTQQVYEAMLSRGYCNVFPTYVDFTLSRSDLAKSGLSITIGVVLILFDRITPALLQ